MNNTTLTPKQAHSTSKANTDQQQLLTTNNTNTKIPKPYKLTQGTKKYQTQLSTLTMNNK